jgi:hypothetical protein
MRHLLLLLCLALFVPPIAGAKDYSTPQVVIDATIRADGTILYEEHRTYRFDGSFSEADYSLSRQGFDEVREIHVREGEEVYRHSASGEPGTFRVRERDRTVDIIWRYQATDEERTFTISYELEGAVIRGEDHAEFFWTYLSDRWERGTDSLVVNLVFEEGQPADGVEWFTRGAQDRAQIARSSDGLHITGGNFSRRDRLEVRTVFPAAHVPDMWVTHPEFTLAAAREQEEAFHTAQREAAELRERRAERWSMFAVITAVLSVLAYIGVWRRYVRRPQLSERLPVEVYGPPSDLPPAVGGAALYNKMVTGQHLIATLFDLCRRGYFKLVEQEPVKVRFQPDRIDYTIVPADEVTVDAGLASWERKLLRLIHESFSAGKDTVREVFDFQSTSGTKWFESWQKEVKAEVDVLGWYSDAWKRAVPMNLASQFPLLGLAIAALLFESPLGLLPLIVVLSMMFGSVFMYQRTNEGERQYRLWKAYRQTLRRGTLNKLGDKMNEHFPYAVALMVSQKRLEELVSAGRADDFMWLSTTHGGMISPAQLSRSISNATSSMSSTVSTGSGASVGSSGGGAGGGAR